MSGFKKVTFELIPEGVTELMQGPEAGRELVLDKKAIAAGRWEWGGVGE